MCLTPVFFGFILKAFQIYSSFSELPKSWKYIIEHDIFLQPNYFKALEKASPKNIQFFYVGIFKNEVLVGLALVQHVQLYLRDMFRKTAVSCLQTFFQSIVSKFLKGNILVVGNLMHTGQHGMHYQESKISQAEYLDNVFKALEELKTKIKITQKKSIRIIVLKDFFNQDSIHMHKHILQSNKLHNIFVQPNMIMELIPSWLTIDDYVNSFKKKYKSRYKRAKKKLGNVTCLELNIDAIKSNSNKLYHLYLNVSNNAKFNTFVLPKEHFYNLKRELKDNFKVFGYYIDDELIAFYTLILNGNNLETYFLGYNISLQQSNQLYLNMLYDMVEFGIEHQYSNIIYARTAMEIKSSVGAKPKEMSIYLKHTNSFFNTILKQVFKLMNPAQNWEVRHPFKG